MAIYEYQCDQDGVFEVHLPMGTAPQSVNCTECGGPARRVISIPMVRRGTRTAVFGAIDHAERSRFEPEVVTSLPASGARRRTPMAPLTPTLARLPRP
ncbi:MAG: zinc ribbon domain-containing protein [Burkholderiales bacterium]|nr:zinc ribbon domain-containing protein [Burkholderiales bacterium]